MNFPFHISKIKGYVFRPKLSLRPTIKHFIILLICFFYFIYLSKDIYTEGKLRNSNDVFQIFNPFSYLIESLKNGHFLSSWMPYRGFGEPAYFEYGFGHLFYLAIIVHIVHFFITEFFTSTWNLYHSFHITSTAFYFLFFIWGTFKFVNLFISNIWVLILTLICLVLGPQINFLNNDFIFIYYFPLLFYFCSCVILNRGNTNFNFLGIIASLSLSINQYFNFFYTFLLLSALFLLTFFISNKDEIRRLLPKRVFTLSSFKLSSCLILLLLSLIPFFITFYRVKISQEISIWNLTDFSKSAILQYIQSEKNQYFFSLEGITRRFFQGHYSKMSPYGHDNLMYPYYGKFLACIVVCEVPWLILKKPLRYLLLFVSFGILASCDNFLQSALFYINPFSTMGSRHPGNLLVFFFPFILLLIACATQSFLTTTTKPKRSAYYFWLTWNISLFTVFLFFSESLLASILIVFTIYSHFKKQICNFKIHQLSRTLLDSIIIALLVVSTFIELRKEISALLEYKFIPIKLVKSYYDSPYFPHMSEYPTFIGHSFPFNYYTDLTMDMGDQIHFLMQPEYAFTIKTHNPYNQSTRLRNFKIDKDFVTQYLNHTGYKRLYWADLVQEVSQLAQVETTLNSQMQQQRRTHAVILGSKDKTHIFTNPSTHPSGSKFKLRLRTENFKKLSTTNNKNLYFYEIDLGKNFPRYFTTNPFSKNRDLITLKVNDHLFNPVYFNKLVGHGDFQINLRSDNRLQLTTEKPLLESDKVELEYLNEFHRLGIEVEKYDYDYLKLKIKRDQDGFLVLHDAFNKNWKAYINGRPLNLYLANKFFKGTFINAGTHILEFKYQNIWPKILYSLTMIIQYLFLGILLRSLFKT